jgi:ArsR family transcriptional regulator
MPTAAREREREAETVATVLKRLAHPARLMAVCHLLRGERYALELSDRLGTTKSNVSQHLSALVAAGILAREQRGNRNYYRIADDRVRALIGFLEASFCPDGGLTAKEERDARTERREGPEDRGRPRHGLPRTAARGQEGDRRRRRG